MRGSENGNADGLSRQAWEKDGAAEPIADVHGHQWGDVEGHSPQLIGRQPLAAVITKRQ